MARRRSCRDHLRETADALFVALSMMKGTSAEDEPHYVEAEVVWERAEEYLKTHPRTRRRPHR